MPGNMEIIVGTESGRVFTLTGGLTEQIIVTPTRNADTAEIFKTDSLSFIELALKQPVISTLFLLALVNGIIVGLFWKKRKMILH